MFLGLLPSAYLTHWVRSYALNGALPRATSSSLSRVSISRDLPAETLEGWGGTEEDGKPGEEGDRAMGARSEQCAHSANIRPARSHQVPIV